MTDWAESDAIVKDGLKPAERARPGQPADLLHHNKQVYQLQDESPAVGNYGLYAAESVLAAFDNAEATPLDSSP